MTEEDAGPLVEQAPVAELSDAEKIAVRDNAINRWLNAKTAAVSAVTEERDARGDVTAICFPEPKKGTQRYNLNAGFKLKLVHGWTYTLGDKDMTDADGEKISIETQVLELEGKIDALGPIAGALLKRLIRWKPELSGSEFEKLDKKDPVEGEIARLVLEITTVKPASPQLDFEPPKDPK